MYNCDEIFVVADIGRVSTNKNVEMILQQSLGNNLKNGRPSQGIALVCTKSEVNVYTLNYARPLITHYRILMKMRSKRHSSRRAKLHKLIE